MASEVGPEDCRDTGHRFARDLSRLSVARLEGLMPFLLTEQKGDVIVGDHEIASVCTRATLFSIEEQVGRDRGDGGAKEGGSVVWMDAVGAEQVLREFENGASH